MAKVTAFDVNTPLFRKIDRELIALRLDAFRAATETIDNALPEQTLRDFDPCAYKTAFKALPEEVRQRTIEYTPNAWHRAISDFEGIRKKTETTLEAAFDNEIEITVHYAKAVGEACRQLPMLEWVFYEMKRLKFSPHFSRDSDTQHYEGVDQRQQRNLGKTLERVLEPFRKEGDEFIIVNWPDKIHSADIYLPAKGGEGYPFGRFAQFCEIVEKSNQEHHEKPKLARILAPAERIAQGIQGVEQSDLTDRQKLAVRVYYLGHLCEYFVQNLKLIRTFNLMDIRSYRIIDTVIEAGRKIWGIDSFHRQQADEELKRAYLKFQDCLNYVYMRCSCMNSTRYWQVLDAKTEFTKREPLWWAVRAFYFSMMGTEGVRLAVDKYYQENPLQAAVEGFKMLEDSLSYKFYHRQPPETRGLI